MIEPRKCIKCGEVKAPTQYYRGSGNTCKECVKKHQSIVNLEKRLAKKEVAENNMEERLRYNYTRASVWVNGAQVMEGGLLIGQAGRDWWEEKKIRHEKWLRRKRKKENAIAAPSAERLGIEVPLEYNAPASHSWWGY